MNIQAVLTTTRDLFINTASVQLAILVYVPRGRSRADMLETIANTIFSMLLFALSILIESNI